MTVQRMPDSDVRPETGSMQFGDDWPGLFVRGDNAAYYARCLSQVLRGEAGVFERTAVVELQKLLSGTQVSP